MMLKQQEDDCDPDGEPYRPTAVDIVLDNPEIALRQVGGGDPVVTRGPSAADLAGLERGFLPRLPRQLALAGVHLRDRLLASTPVTCRPPCTPMSCNSPTSPTWCSSSTGSTGTTTTGTTSTRATGKGSRSSSRRPRSRRRWRGSRSPSGTRSTRAASAPTGTTTSSNARAITRSCTRRPGRTPATSARRCTSAGARARASDATPPTGPSDRVEPEVIVLPDAVDDPDDPLAWLAFNGRWGERQNGLVQRADRPGHQGALARTGAVVRRPARLERRDPRRRHAGQLGRSACSATSSSGVRRR